MSEVTEEEFDRVTGINIKGCYFSIQSVLPTMRAQKKGSVVIVASDQSFIGKASQNLYGLTKGAVGQLTKSCAIEYAHEGVRFNSINPGTIWTPLADGAT